MSKNGKLKETKQAVRTEENVSVAARNSLFIYVKEFS